MNKSNLEMYFRFFRLENRRDYLPYFLIIAAIFATIFLLYFQGRVWRCGWDAPYDLWSSDAWGKHNSQHLFDPYSFTHVLHGFLYFWFLSLFFCRLSFKWLLFAAVSLESAWEILENSDYVIEHYRAATLALNYFGDSILNSFGDILSCAFGFVFARKIGFRRSFALFVFIEIILIFWIHDSLLINIIMLIHPFEAIKTWQSGA